MGDRAVGGFRPPLSLARRLGLAIALVLTLGGVAAGVAAFAYGRQAAQEAYDRLLIGAADQIAASILIRDGAPIADLPPSAFDLLALAREDRVVYRILGPGGRTLTGYDDAALPPPRARGGPSLYDATFRGAPVRMVAVTRGFAERSFSGAVRVLVGQTTRARDALAREIALSALTVAGAAGVVITGLALFAIRSALEPLRRIAHGLSLRDPRDLTPLSVDAPSEIGGLVTAINRFMARLERQMSAMRNLIGDSAHQLRTPIAALRAQAELAAEETDPDRQRAIVARIHARSLGLSRLTDQLLSRAMIIHRADSAPRGPVDLRRVAMAAAEQADFDHLSDGETLRLDLPDDPVDALGDALSLTEAIKNLIANAYRHGAAPVVLSVRIDGARVVLAVGDAGPGLPGDPGRAGRRFAHGATSPDGAGLGLAIVRAVAAAHGGDLRFGRDAAGRFEAALRLPGIAP
ncbi:MAG: two-component system sensor histidine kinase TctE [Paracoccaceae bacterium]|jgi:two-component system sensor histidine kinase TctE